MGTTTNYALEKYEAGNAANLLDQYNASMDKIDAAIKSASDKADLALNNNVLPDGLAAFILLTAVFIAWLGGDHDGPAGPRK